MATSTSGWPSSSGSVKSDSLGESQLAVSGVLDLVDMMTTSGNRSQMSQTLREAGLLLAHADRQTEAALALLARRGPPSMPTGGFLDFEGSPALAGTGRRTRGSVDPGSRYELVALSEPELIELVPGRARPLETPMIPSHGLRDAVRACDANQAHQES